MKRTLIFAGVSVVAVVAILLFLRDRDRVPTTLVPDGEVGTPSGTEGERAAALDRGDGGSERVDASGPTDAIGAQASPGLVEPSTENPTTRTLTEEELRGIDVEQQERERLERVEAFRAEQGGPISCESVCDCPQGLDCQLPPGICVPASREVYCCTDDLCPAGNQCARSDGRLGVCADN